LEDLLPSRADVDLVLDNLPSSASGPDGIAFAVFSRFREIVAPIILDITHGMIEGRLRPDDDFNPCQKGQARSSLMGHLALNLALRARCQLWMHPTE
jgi:hypothetical protein